MFAMRSVDRFGAVLMCSLGCVIAAGCSGGTGMQTSPPIARTLTLRSTQSSGGNVSFAIAIKHTTAGQRRSPKYVSPSTLSMKVLTDGGNPVVVNLEAGAPNCAENGGTLICTASFSVAAGTHVFTVTTYDQLNAGGNVLSTNTTGPVYVKPVGTTTVSVVLEGVVAYIALALATNNPAAAGAPATIGLQAVARDVDRNIIVGPAAYDNPITLTTTDPVNGALTTTKLTSPADSANLRYSGAKVANITVGATAAGVPPANVANAVLYPGTQNLYVANYSGSISVFDVAYPASPITTILINPMLHPTGVAVGSSGLLYVSTGEGNLLLFDTQHFNAPVQTPPLGLGFSGDGLTIDASGKLYAAGNPIQPEVGGEVVVFTTQPFAYNETISGPCLAGSTFPWGVALGLNGRLYVTNVYTNSGESVCVFDTQHGNAPLPGISGLTEAFGAVVDASGKLYVADYEGGPTGSGAVAIFDTVHGNAALEPIDGGGLTYPQGGVVLDASGKLYVANSNNTVSVFDTLHGNAPLPPISGGLSGATGLAIH
jgi:hypothetical protein